VSSTPPHPPNRHTQIARFDFSYGTMVSGRTQVHSAREIEDRKKFARASGRGGATGG
jgi:hypothetical protein